MARDLPRATLCNAFSVGFPLGALCPHPLWERITNVSYRSGELLRVRFAVRRESCPAQLLGDDSGAGEGRIFPERFNQRLSLFVLQSQEQEGDRASLKIARLARLQDLSQRFGMLGEPPNYELSAIGKRTQTYRRRRVVERR